MKTAILTDTNSGISSAEAEELGIFLIPMPIIINDETFYEGQSITEEAFYQALASDKKVTTSQPSPADVLDYWDSLLQKGFDEVVYIPMSSDLATPAMLLWDLPKIMLLRCLSLIITVSLLH